MANFKWHFLNPPKEIIKNIKYYIYNFWTYINIEKITINFNNKCIIKEDNNLKTNNNIYL